MNLVEVALYFNELQLRALEDHLNFDGTTIKTDLERLRGICVNEVKKINGSITFDEAIGWQS